MKKSIRIIQWIPRILGILTILFISMFALDSFVPGMPFLQQVAGFLIHMVPSFVLLVFLLVAWKWELVGGSILLILGLAFVPFIYMMNFHMNNSVWMSLGVILVINGPVLLVGALFVLSHFLKVKNGGGGI
jgi:hypothetical protein